MRAVSAFLLLLACLAGGRLGAAATAPAPAKLTSERWTAMTERIGPVAFDGAWRKAIPLAAPETLQALGVRVELRHRLESDMHGRPRSWWEVPALRTSLAPEGREHLLWQPPGGLPAVKFTMALIGRAFGLAGSPRWSIRAQSEQVHEIQDVDGRTWIYTRGRLSELRHPSLGRFAVKTRGGLISSMRAADDGSDAFLVQARYDEAGVLHELRLGQSDRYAFRWSEHGEMLACTKNGELLLEVEYRNSLVVGFTETGQPKVALRWQANPGWRRGDHHWPAPWHLAQAGDWRYRFAFTQRGFLLEARNGADGERVRTWSNPRRRRIEQEVGGQTLVAFLSKASNGGRVLERIESGSGEVLEEYQRDARGLLTAVIRKGEPVRRISYDKAGRLMGMEAVDLP